MSEKKESFESAVKKLETIIQSLEAEDISLERALRQFETGIKLIRVCESHLNSAEGRIKELVQGEDGSYIEKILGLTKDAVNGEVKLNEE